MTPRTSRIWSSGRSAAILAQSTASTPAGLSSDRMCWTATVTPPLLREARNDAGRAPRHRCASLHPRLECPDGRGVAIRHLADIVDAASISGGGPWDEAHASAFAGTI